MALVLFLAGSRALAQNKPPGSVKLVRVIQALPPGTAWLKLKVSRSAFGFSCIFDGVTEVTEGHRDLKLTGYGPAFKTVLDGAGYKVVTPGEDNLFESEGGAADLEVAAVLTNLQVDGCISAGNLMLQKGAAKGDATMSVDWQVYARLRKEVVAKVSTTASLSLIDGTQGGIERLLSDLFATNARLLAAEPSFRAAVDGSGPSTTATAPASGTESKIALAGSLKAGKRQISDAVGSVVTILTGSGSGSGDLVSSDGYMLTNYHVVGDEKQVRVRWSDGIETVAEVVRVSKTRDIALIKTNPRDREPLAIKRGPVNPGQRVFAIGSPLGKAYQGSVSSGVVSATRTMEGMRYIQSDVAISHGSSGGALLDENGAVIGVAVFGIDPGVASGLHFFIPIGDAMDFLNLEQQ